LVAKPKWVCGSYRMDPAPGHRAALARAFGPLPETELAIGIDLGLTHFAVLSDGRKIASPTFLRRAERALRPGLAPGAAQ
jgi:transposase